MRTFSVSTTKNPGRTGDESPGLHGEVARLLALAAELRQRARELAREDQALAARIAEIHLQLGLPVPEPTPSISLAAPTPTPKPHPARERIGYQFNH